MFEVKKMLSSRSCQHWTCSVPPPWLLWICTCVGTVTASACLGVTLGFQLIFSYLTEQACNDNQLQLTVQITRQVHRDGTVQGQARQVKPVGKDQGQNQGGTGVGTGEPAA